MASSVRCRNRKKQIKLFQNKNFGFTQKKSWISFGSSRFLLYFCWTILIAYALIFKSLLKL